MASRCTGYWRTVANHLGRRTRSLTTSTAPKSKAFPSATPQVMANADRSGNSKTLLKGELFPVYVALGMISVSLSLGLITAKQELLYSPNVFLSKKRRESVPEVVDPDYVVDEVDKLIRKSLFRKVARVQDYADRNRAIGANLNSRDALTSSKKVETLKTVGVSPATH